MKNTKIGARELSREEALLIVPTLDEIYNQIDSMYLSKNESTDDANAVAKAASKIRKTNNIGILGCRGAGKTSVLRTIKHELEEQNRKKKSNHIVLDIIVPENMSTSSTLMENVLGLFKHEVENLSGNDKNQYKNCIQERSDLKEKYHEVIRQYTYIQKEYRNILIREFTTENEYVKKSKEVFNSDSEFIRKLDSFLEELVYAKSKWQADTEKNDKMPLIFLFIDDIDLSTYRCTDVVKTLLSYLSNRNIVTFISGDINTFEEALTLDFLRQEGALDSNVFGEAYYNEGVSLLERKKELAYEYLKKVIPPMYRHSIKSWGLTERGDYLIQDGETGKSLLELLLEKFRGYLSEHLFQYQEYRINENGEEEACGTVRIPYYFHLFDETSRGLNNIYALLQQINADEEGRVDFAERKLIIETIVAAKPVYNKYRDFILGELITFGNNEKYSEIRFDKLIAGEASDRAGEQEQSYLEKLGLNKLESFQIFILADFSRRILLKKEARFNENYKLAKQSALCLLLENPEISLYSEKNYKYSGETAAKDDTSYEFLEMSIAYNFLNELKLEFAFIYYRKSIGLEKTMWLYKIELAEKTEKNVLKAKIENYICAVYFTVQSICRNKKEDMVSFISQMYEKFPMEFIYIQNTISGSGKKLGIDIYFEGMIEIPMEHILEAVGDSTVTEYAEAYDPKLSIYIRLLFNLLEHEYRAFEECDILQELANINQDRKSARKEMKRLEIIQNINKKDLWDAPLAANIISYLQLRLGKLLSETLYISWIELPEEFKAEYNAFCSEYRGTRNTLANQLKRYLEAKLANTERVNNRWVPGIKYWFEIRMEIYKLAYNRRARYGRTAAAKMINAMNQSIPVLELSAAGTEAGDENRSEKRNLEYVMLVSLTYYFIEYRKKTLDQSEISNHKKQLGAFYDLILEAQHMVDKKEVTDFIAQINQGIEGSQIEEEEFEELFVL